MEPAIPHSSGLPPPQITAQDFRGRLEAPDVSIESQQRPRMKGVEELLAELREHGTIDSRGEFTLSLSEARRKLVQYHFSDKARYLLLLLSAGTAAGARSLTVEQTPILCRLQMPGAHIPESALLNAFAHPERPADAPGASDLVLGLQGAFHNQATRVEVRAQRPGESFLWTLEPRSEQSVPIDSGGETGLEVLLHFKLDVGQRLRGVLGWLRGYAARSSEARLLDKYCDRSLIPLSYNGERSDRPLFLPALSVLATVGELGDKKLEFPADTQLEGYAWRGVLALGPGAIQIVIHGVAYCQIESLGLAGTIYHDGLERDLSREKVVRDAAYDSLISELEGVKIALSGVLVDKLSSVPWPLVVEQLPDLVYLFLARKLEAEKRQALWEGMERIYRDRAQEGVDRAFPPSPKGLVDLMTGLVQDVTARQRVLDLLLSDCGEGLRKQPTGFHKQLLMTHDLFRAHHPEETLVLGYLLLGLGALHSVKGRAQESERAWFRTLETVWAGTDARAQELMYAHMAHTPEHILQQSSTALAMYCAEDSE